MYRKSAYNRKYRKRKAKALRLCRRGETEREVKRMIRYIVKRSGDKVSFDARKIKSAIFKANTRIAAERMSDADLNELTEEVLTALEKLPGTPTAQEIQNVVEEKLLAADYAKTANAYINYRTEHEHLREMDDLRQSVQNATYEQKDPLLIYKLESFQLFSKMLNKVNADVLSTLNKAYIPVRENTAENVQRERQERAKVDVNKLQASRMQAAAQAGQAEKQKPMPVHVEKKAGRNDPCPCGSGKKYKNCHGKGL